MAIGGLLSNQSTYCDRICRDQPDGPRKIATKISVLKENTVFALMVEGHGLPLSTVVCGANRHDSVMSLLAERFVSAEKVSNGDDTLHLNLCLDAGYVGRKDVVEASCYDPHIRYRSEEKREIENNPDFHARH